MFPENAPHEFQPHFRRHPIRRMPGQFAPNPKNPMPRRGGSRVSRTGREEYGPLSGPCQRAVRAVYKIPPRTSSAPSPIRNILASQFIVATHNRTEIQASALRFVPELAGRPSRLAVVVGPQAWALIQRAAVISRRSGAEMSIVQERPLPPMHMIKLTETREITPRVWVHPDEEL
jgi:hypothetical protein